MQQRLQTQPSAKRLCLSPRDILSRTIRRLDAAELGCHVVIIFVETTASLLTVLALRDALNDQAADPSSELRSPLSAYSVLLEEMP